MLTHLRMLMTLLSAMTLMGDPAGIESDPAPDPDPEKKPEQKPEPPVDKSQWTVEQWDAELSRVAAKEKAEGKRAAERAHQEQVEKAKQDAELQKQEAEGKYEEAKQSLTRERDTAVSERDKALELLKNNVDTQWDKLPDEVKQTYAGDDEDVLAKTKHMQRMKPVIERLSAEAAKEKERKNPGNGTNPTPSTKPTTSAEDEEAKRRMRPRF